MSAKIILPHGSYSFFWWGICHLAEFYVKYPGEHSKKWLRQALAEIPGKKARREVSQLVAGQVVRFREEKKKGLI